MVHLRGWAVPGQVVMLWAGRVGGAGRRGARGSSFEVSAPIRWTSDGTAGAASASARETGGDGSAAQTALEAEIEAEVLGRSSQTTTTEWGGFAAIASPLAALPEGDRREDIDRELMRRAEAAEAAEAQRTRGRRPRTAWARESGLDRQALGLLAAAGPTCWRAACAVVRRERNTQTQ
ncbi:unnamed protein product [Prorocentrum cordatum]|uniref:Uncharacterized protein n=1 Tax=Prorocentrum cordatum TaxID=2364126 RepID=A0ABN9VXG7_9DINO|nr:unnamed protein product [Polarella glacialis]